MNYYTKSRLVTEDEYIWRKHAGKDDALKAKAESKKTMSGIKGFICQVVSCDAEVSDGKHGTNENFGSEREIS